MKRAVALGLMALLLLPLGTVCGSAISYGDVNGDGRIDPEDPLQLRNYFAGLDFVTGISIYTLSAGADADADGSVSVRDLMLMLRYFALMDPETGISPIHFGPQSSSGPVNLYSFFDSYCGIFDPDGYRIYSSAYHTSAPIDVSRGDILSFGPVYPQQQLYVTAWTAGGKISEQITSVSHLTVSEKFSDGGMICRYAVPDDAAEVRVTCLSAVYNTFLLTRNRPFTGEDYEAFLRENGLEDYIRFVRSRADLPTVSRSLLWCGDSIGVGYYEHEYPGTSAAGITSKTKNLGTNPAWCGRVADLCGIAEFKNTSKGGASLSTKRADVTNIYTQLRNNASAKYDYIVIEGGAVDIGGSNGIKAPLGTLSEGYELKDFDGENTFIGALERAFYYAVTQAPDAHIVFLIAYSTPQHENNSNAWEEYWQYVPFVCEKWGIPYIDLWNNAYVNRVFDTNRTPGGKNSDTAFYHDTLHVSPMGYDVTSLEIAMEIVGIPSYDAADRHIPDGLPAVIARGNSSPVEPTEPAGTSAGLLPVLSGTFAGRLGRDGSEIPDGDRYFTTGLLPVAPGDVLYFGPANPSQGYHLNVYSASKTVIRGWVGADSLKQEEKLPDGSVIFSCTIPADAAFVRLTFPAGIVPVAALNQPITSVQLTK